MHLNYAGADHIFFWKRYYAHIFKRIELLYFADFLGDSFSLSQKADSRGADTIAFEGLRESIKLEHET